jgi:hypothetical protein
MAIFGESKQVKAGKYIMRGRARELLAHTSTFVSSLNTTPLVELTLDI